jgi:hypothetical protein
VQPPFGAVQIPQLALQQTVPGAHRVDPQAGPDASFGRQFP